jgi:hypothetical protein
VYAVAVPQADSLGQLIRGAIDHRLHGLRVSVPGEIVSYVAATQRCRVQPLAFVRVGDEEQPMPVLDDVPVCWPRAGGCAVILPIAAGDKVTVSFSDRELDGYRGTGLATEPTGPRAHHLSDAFVLPMGIWPDAQPLLAGALAGTDVVVVRDGSTCIAIKADGSVVVGDVVGGVLSQAVTLDPMLRLQLLQLPPVLAAMAAATTAAAAAAADPTPVAAAAATAAAAAAQVLVATLAAWPAPTTAALKTRAV